MEKNKKQILVVDDSEHNIDLIIDALGDQYCISVATNGPDALNLMDNLLPELILLDVMMPGMDGYEVCRVLKSDYRFSGIPIIFLTALTDDADETKGLALGAVDYITKPFNPHLLAQRVKTHMLLKEHRDHLEQKVKQQSHLLNITQDVTIEIAGKLAEYRDEETGEHIIRTKNYIRLLALQSRSLKKSPARTMDDRYIDLLTKSAPLHDIGKVAIPDHILLKPGKLDTDEFERIKQHTVYGRDIIMNSTRCLGRESFLTIAQEIAYTHHEKWDGTGYPEGLKGTDIPLTGRLMALADVYDALISKRIYKPAFSHEKAVQIIASEKGRHFDPELVEVFLSCERQFHEIAVTYADPDGCRKGRYC
jgi:putative two-component system response regulator